MCAETNVIVETVQLTAVNKGRIRKSSEIIGFVETKRLFELYADLIHSVSYKLRTDETLFSVPLDIKVNREQSEKII